MSEAITKDEIRTLKQIARGTSSESISGRNVARLQSLGYIRETATGLHITQEGMMWIVGGTDD
jgi:hypothetical protein